MCIKVKHTLFETYLDSREYKYVTTIYGIDLIKMTLL